MSRLAVINKERLRTTNKTSSLNKTIRLWRLRGNVEIILGMGILSLEEADSQHSFSTRSHPGSSHPDEQGNLPSEPSPTHSMADAHGLRYFG